MTGCTSGGYDQLETYPETIEQELRPTVCKRRQTDRLMENYSIDGFMICQFVLHDRTVARWDVEYLYTRRVLCSVLFSLFHSSGHAATVDRRLLCSVLFSVFHSPGLATTVDRRLLCSVLFSMFHSPGHAATVDHWLLCSVLFSMFHSPGHATTVDRRLFCSVLFSVFHSPGQLPRPWTVGYFVVFIQRVSLVRACRDCGPPATL